MTAERHPITVAPILLVADAGLRVDLPPPDDPIQAWLDLMEVIEMLSAGRSPAVRISREGWAYLL